MKMYNTFNLPQDVIRLIYAFCIDKRENWNKVREQFLKGGFNQKNLYILPYIQRQKEMCLETWLFTRPELNEFAQWDWATSKMKVCFFKYDNEGWSIKKKCAVVYFKNKTNIIKKYSSRNPVSKWLKNINKFENAVKNSTSFSPYFSNKTILNYLPKEKNKFGIKFESLFYKKRAVIIQKKRKRKAQLEKVNLFIEERRNLKKICGFEKKQLVVLSFNMPNDILGSKLKFYTGVISDVFFKRHRDHAGRLIFLKPKGKYVFDNDAIDNYIGETHISVRFEDGEVRNYTPEKLLSRIQQSMGELDLEIKKGGIIRGWYKPSLDLKGNSCLYEKVTIKDVQCYVRKKKATDDNSENTMLVFDQKCKMIGKIIKLRETWHISCWY